jgi:nucleoside-diphosphate-sugar epimerase
VSLRTPVLITGHRGYIGSVMAPYLQEQGYDVVGLDTGYFDECTLVPDRALIPEIRKDIRDLEPADVADFYAVIHLAALSNDPIGNLNERWTAEINYQASVQLARLARAAEVRRFLFSSSCIMYGMSEAEVVDETAPLGPKTEYARSKVKAEQALSDLANDHFSPIFLRNGTIYGVSPRMRFDTVLNDLVGSAVATGKVIVRGNGKPWRPVVHVEDVARAFHAVLEAPRVEIHNQAFNTGADHLNHQIRELGEIVVDVVPGSQLEVLGEPGADQRTYKADFSKFRRRFPDFQFKWNARTGAEQLAETFRRIGLTEADYRSAKFTRLKWLTQLRETGRLDDSLRWTAGSEARR